MVLREQSEVHFLDKTKIPKLLSEGSGFVIQPENDVFTVGERLYFPVIDKTLEIRQIDLLLGKRFSVAQTEIGHRYLVFWNSSDTFAPNISGRIKFERK